MARLSRPRGQHGATRDPLRHAVRLASKRAAACSTSASLPKPAPAHRYRRPYEGTDNQRKMMQAYLDWEFGLVEQLARDGTHGFFVI